MSKWLAGVLVVLACVASPPLANAQSAGAAVQPSCGNANYTILGQLEPLTQLQNGELCITGSITTSVSGFQPSAFGARGTQLSVTTSDSSGNLPTGAVTDVTNTDTTNPMYCNVNGIAATTSDKLIAPRSWFEFTIPASVTVIHCIATGGTVLANMVGGSGLGTGAGGGSGSGGGSSGAVFGPTAAGTAAANPPVLCGGTVDGTATGAVKNCKVDANLNLNVDAPSGSALLTAIQAAIPAGSNDIGTIGVHSIVNVTPTDCSGTISSGGTAQNAFAANAAIHGWIIANLSADPMWISFTTTAAVGATQSYLLAAGSASVQGGSFASPLGYGMNTALSLIAATTSDKYSCTRW